MDKTDQLLLRELMINSRIHITQLAKKLKISREVATYRLNRLKKESVILDFVTEIDYTKLGFVAAAVFINVKSTKQKEFKEFLSKTDFVSWVAELSGLWSFGLSIVGKTIDEVNQHLLQILNKFKEDIIDHRFTLHHKSTFFYEKYLDYVSQIKTKNRKVEYQVDHKDKIILHELSKNSRLDCVYLARKVKLTAPAVANRIRKLESSGYISKYSIFVDISKLGLFQYSVFVTNKDVIDKENFVNHLRQHKNISFIAKYIGDQFIEFGIFVRDPYNLRERLQEIEEKFPHNRVIEMSLFQKEFVSIGLPSCIFK
ncbi:hypothetical protein COY27_00035 [Candidatus Woesearchaeota archaeon CG_4_10_14_0_2_um_filter_33_13]|nr:MAG: hypothetical protein COY27_00035 [Candidatus Woesearchaeota archaeon CG_4_10_14_0_2_um_filter_33_13]